MTSATETGRDILSELSSATWWEDTEQQERDRVNDDEACLCPLIPFFDGAELDGQGRTSTKVAMVACGNFVNKILRKTGSRELIALIPDLKVSKDQAKRAVVRRARRLITQACMKAIFEHVEVSPMAYTFK